MAGFGALVASYGPLEVCQSTGDCDGADLARAKGLFAATVRQQFPVECAACRSAVARVKPLVDGFALEALGSEARGLCEAETSVGSWAECDLGVSRITALIFRYVRSREPQQVCANLGLCSQPHDSAPM